MRSTRIEAVPIYVKLLEEPEKLLSHRQVQELEKLFKKYDKSPSDIMRDQGAWEKLCHKVFIEIDNIQPFKQTGLSIVQFLTIYAKLKLYQSIHSAHYHIELLRYISLLGLAAAVSADNDNEKAHRPQPGTGSKDAAEELVRTMFDVVSETFSAASRKKPPAESVTAYAYRSEEIDIALERFESLFTEETTPEELYYVKSLLKRGWKEAARNKLHNTRPLRKTVPDLLIKSEPRAAHHSVVV